MKKALIFWFRWILVLPGGLVIAFLSTFPLHWVLYLAFAQGTLLGIVELPLRSDILIEKAIYPAVIAVVFVYYGSLIAPKFRIYTAAVLGAIYLMVEAALITLSLTGSQFMSVYPSFSWRSVMVIIAVICTLFVVIKRESGETKKSNIS